MKTPNFLIEFNNKMKTLAKIGCFNGFLKNGTIILSYHMQLQKLDHFGINVVDIGKSSAWYEKVFGLKVVHVWPSGTTMIGNELFKIGIFSRPQGVKIADTDNTICITHVAFLTTADGLLEIQAYLNEMGVPFQPLEDTGIAYSIFLSDPDGNQIEITTYYDTN